MSDRQRTAEELREAVECLWLVGCETKSASGYRTILEDAITELLALREQLTERREYARFARQQERG